MNIECASAYSLTICGQWLWMPLHSKGISSNQRLKRLAKAHVRSNGIEEYKWMYFRSPHCVILRLLGVRLLTRNPALKWFDENYHTREKDNSFLSFLFIRLSFFARPLCPSPCSIQFVVHIFIDNLNTTCAVANSVINFPTFIFYLIFEP